jgi:hypothetical protein
MGIALPLTPLLVFAWNAGKWLVVDDPQSADVIVVLAGETYQRPLRALQLLDQGVARRVVIDVPAAATIYKFSQLELAKEYVRGLPEATSVEICPIEGLSTREESHDVGKCLAHEDGTRVLIVTSDYHTRRALSIFRHEIRGKTFAVAAAYDDSEFGARWWAHREWSKTCVSEWARFLWWSGFERWK